LHEVLDEWFARQVVPRLAGRATLVRFADDLVIIFEYERDARRVFEVLPKRLAKYGLTLHPEKTRLIDFRRPDRRVSSSPNNGDVRSARHRRLAGRHSLLGHVPQGILGGEAEGRTAV
jgi:Reverse transcriptase (RNA-dependent DNA polymerase)